MRVVLPLLLLAGAAALWWREPAPPYVPRELATPFRLLQLSLLPPDEALAMPVEGVPIRRVADTWHAARPGNRQHQGTDIFAPRGTPVLAATEGVVVRIGQNELGGNIVMVAGSGGRGYYYAHLDRFAEHLDEGDWVNIGDRLGYVGNTGNARTTPSHLHFGVYGAEGAINPVPLLVANAPVPEPPRRTTRQRGERGA